MLTDSPTCNVQGVDLPLEYESYAVQNCDGARISKHCSGGKLVEYLDDNCKTLIEMMERGCRLSENGRCVGFRSSKAEYSWLTYNEFLEKSRNFGSGLVKLGIAREQTVGIYAKNSVQWLIAQYGCFYQCAMIVPLYDSLQADACTFMINHGELSVVICDKISKAKSMLQRNTDTPSLKHIITMDTITDDVQQLSIENNVKLHRFKDIEELGKREPVPCNFPKPCDVAIICYTSGTTGNPKGAMLSHSNIMAALAGCLIQTNEVKFNKGDVMISYLPLAHIMEQICEAMVFYNGGSVGFYSGDIKNLTDDMKILKPTFFPAVPRLLNKLYDQAQDQIKREKRKLELPLQLEHLDLKNDEFDPLLFKSFHNSLGGNLRVIVTGAAPVTQKVLLFFHFTLNCEVIELYGQTEASGPCTLNVVNPKLLGHVGPPMACIMIKLLEVPELGYYKDNNSGEVCVKGPSVFKGYFNDPEKTKEAIDESGWLHTGDIGMWLPNGTLKIIDRKKHIFKLSQGEFVAPEKIEHIYLQSPYISQILVYGDPLKSYLVAIIIPEKEVVMSRYGKNSRSDEWEDICNNPTVRQLIFEDMKKIANKTGLISFEQVKTIHLHPHNLTFEDGHLTPTMKTKRLLCQNLFMKQILEMYNGKDI